MISTYISFMDNGMGLARTRWARSLFGAAIDGAFGSRKIVDNYFSSPYPSEIMQYVSKDFLASKCDEIFLFDLDIIFTSKDVRNLLSHDLPYVGGIVPKRVMGLELAVWPHEPKERLVVGSEGSDLVDADFGRGFCLINRSVFEDVKHLCAEYQDLHTGETLTEYFKGKPGGGSEDFAFCEMWRSLGNKAYIDRRICVQHEGSAIYPIKGTY